MGPYIWDESFMTFYKRIDDEHKVLFDCIRESAEDPSNAEKHAFCKTKLRMHFDYKEGEFCKVEGYDCYGHYLKHYNFQTKFQSADLHLPVSQHPDDANKLQVLKDNMDLHFQYEEQRFCAIPNFACVQHKMKHYKFWVVLEDQQVPVGCEEINWAKNWLAQHIKNTDHQYRKRMIGDDSGENFSGALP